MVVLVINFGSYFMPYLYINYTNSEPKGIYISVDDRDFNVGDLVIMKVPENMYEFVYGRGWLPEKTPLLKSIGALTGISYETHENNFYVDGVYIGTVSKIDSLGRFLPQIKLSRHIVEEGYFLPISTYNEHSFDGRYFGAIPVGLIKTKVKPLLIIDR